MAPKPPPIESSEKTGSSSDESEEMDQSIPRAAALKNAAPLSQKVQQSKAEEGEEGEEEEVEEEKDEQHQEEEGDEEDEEGEDDTEGEEDEQHQEEEEKGDGDDEEGEEEDTEGKEEEEEEENGRKQKEAKKSASPCSEEDEVHFLNAIIAHRRKHGKHAMGDELEAVRAGSLEYSPSQLKNKIKNLRNFYRRNVCKVKPPSKGRNARIICLCKAVWDEDDMLAYDTVSSDFGEMCEAYPYLGENSRRSTGRTRACSRGRLP
jgi:hypothetical protein